MKWILALLITVTCLGDISPIERTIDSITYHSQSGQTIALIKLSDGSMWKWLPDFYCENLLRNWQEGDEIIIQANCHPGLVLFNQQRPYYKPKVALTFNSYPFFPSIDSVDADGTIFLSDGTAWDYLYHFNKRTLRYWATGDQIIPVHGAGETFQLINIDIPSENRLQIERFIEVIPNTLKSRTSPDPASQNP